MKLTLPTQLTVLRMVLIPVLVVSFYLPWQWNGLLAWFFFTVAGITDWLDGYLARKLGESSVFGAFLDPVADKLLISATLVILIEAEHTIYLTIPALIIIGREIIISALREWMAIGGEQHVIKVSNWGKWKTGTQMVAIGGFLIYQSLPWVFIQIVSYLCLYVAMILTIISMVQYIHSALPYFKT
ncbi:MAG TPA: CDP-diacylglycerol--glycerol-3-phosphate 3-phosphatidyltransferase [Crenotrichaceae bacterium]|nr:CDP-diacylglycerol--glycerol-3-phosphate 3-phosphatidyltransferase [Crenotrichaceae bacterium]